MVNSRTARRVESILPGWEVLFSEQSIVILFFLISLSFLPLNHLCSFPSIGDLVCVGSTTQTSLNEVNLPNHVHLPDTFFLLHLAFY